MSGLMSGQILRKFSAAFRNARALDSSYFYFNIDRRLGSCVEKSCWEKSTLGISADVRQGLNDEPLVVEGGGGRLQEEDYYLSKNT